MAVGELVEEVTERVLGEVGGIRGLASDGGGFEHLRQGIGRGAEHVARARGVAGGDGVRGERLRPLADRHGAQGQDECAVFGLFFEFFDASRGAFCRGVGSGFGDLFGGQFAGELVSERGDAFSEFLVEDDFDLLGLACHFEHVRSFALRVSFPLPCLVKGFPRRRKGRKIRRGKNLGSGDLHVLGPTGGLDGEVDLAAEDGVGGDGVLGAHADAHAVDVDHVPDDEGAVGGLTIATDDEAFGSFLEGFHGEVLVGMLGVGVVDDFDARTGDLLPAGVFVVHRAVLTLVADRILRWRAGPAAQGHVVGQVGAGADFGRCGLVDVADGRHPDGVYLAVRRGGRDLDSQVEGHFRSLKRNPPRPMALEGCGVVSGHRRDQLNLKVRRRHWYSRLVSSAVSPAAYAPLSELRVRQPVAKPSASSRCPASMGIMWSSATTLTESVVVLTMRMVSVPMPPWTCCVSPMVCPFVVTVSMIHGGLAVGFGEVCRYTVQPLAGCGMALRTASVNVMIDVISDHLHGRLGHVFGEAWQLVFAVLVEFVRSSALCGAEEGDVGEAAGPALRRTDLGRDASGRRLHLVGDGYAPERLVAGAGEVFANRVLDVLRAFLHGHGDGRAPCDAFGEQSVSEGSEFGRVEQACDAHASSFAFQRQAVACVFSDCGETRRSFLPTSRGFVDSVTSTTSPARRPEVP
nr:MAG TPA: hypothetical protein [Caudoviricetes sp.]